MSIQYTADQLQRKFQGAPGAGGFARIAEVLREEGRHEEAIALCREGLAARPGHVTGLLVLGKCLLDLDKPEEAREPLEAALRQDSRCLSALHLLARAMAKLQWPDAAAAYYRSILEIEPWDTETLARLRDLSPAGASPAGFADAGPDAQSAMPAPQPVAPAVEQFDLDSAVDFVPAEPNPADLAGDLAGALEEISLEDALSATPEAATPAAPPRPTPSDLAEPRPLDILPSAPAPAPEGDEDIGEPAPISGDDIGERLDSLFGVQDDKPVLKAAPPAPTPSPSPSPFAGDATLQMPAFAGETPAATAAVPAPEPSSLLRDDGPGVPDLPAAAEPPGFDPEDRVSGEDIEDRLDALFSLSEDAGNRTAPPPAPGDADLFDAGTSDLPASATWSARPAEAGDADAAPDLDATVGFAPAGTASADEAPADEAAMADAFAPRDPDSEAPATEDFLAAAAASDTAERPAFLGDRPALDPFAAEPEAEAADPIPAAGDVILSAGPDEGSAAIADDEVVTGQDVADKLDALFGEPAPRVEPDPRADAPRGPAETGVFPAPDGLPAGTASWAAARPDDTLPAETRAAFSSASPTGPAFPSPPAPELPAEGAFAPADLLTTENMLPRGIADLGRSGRDSAPPVTGADIEDRLDSLFNLGEPGPAAEAPADAFAPASETAFAAPFPDFGADSASDAAPPAAAEPEPPVAGTGAPAGGMPADPDEPGRTLIMPAMRETASDWLAHQAADAPPPDTADVLAAEPGAQAAPAGTGASDTVGLEMVDGSDIEDRLDQIFSPEEAAAQAAKAAAEDAIARGEATPEGDVLLPEVEAPALETGEMPLPVDAEGFLAQEMPAPSAGEELSEPPIAGTMVSGEDIKNRLSEIFEDGPQNAEPQYRGTDTIADGSLLASDLQQPAWEPLPEPDGLDAVAGPADAPFALPEAGTADQVAGPEAGTEGPAETSGLPPAAGSAARAPVAPLAPLEDEEEGSLEEPENELQSAAGANVATVTLAEIYFQQGLREQALQIYRQLLEREPGNESVRKRIQEIEASKPEAGPGPGADPRRPRPGLKVPKRKK